MINVKGKGYNCIVYKDGEEVRRHSDINDQELGDIIFNEVLLGHQLFIEDAEEELEEEEND